jgi:hypothetical protein
MTIEAMKQALEALEMLARYENPETRIQVRKPKDSGPIVTMYPHKVATDAAAALRTAIAEAESVEGTVKKHLPVEQEPVAWAVVGDGEWGDWVIGNQFETSKPPDHKYWENRGYELVPLYTIPPETPGYIKGDTRSGLVDNDFEENT